MRTGMLPPSTTPEKRRYAPLTPSPLNPNTAHLAAAAGNRQQADRRRTARSTRSAATPDRTLVRAKPLSANPALNLNHESPTRRLLRQKAAAAWWSETLRHKRQHQKERHTFFPPPSGAVHPHAPVHVRTEAQVFFTRADAADVADASAAPTARDSQPQHPGLNHSGGRLPSGVSLPQSGQMTEQGRLRAQAASAVGVVARGADAEELATAEKTAKSRHPAALGVVGTGAGAGAGPGAVGGGDSGGAASASLTAVAPETTDGCAHASSELAIIELEPGLARHPLLRRASGQREVAPPVVQGGLGCRYAWGSGGDHGLARIAVRRVLVAMALLVGLGLVHGLVVGGLSIDSIGGGGGGGGRAGAVIRGRRPPAWTRDGVIG